MSTGWVYVLSNPSMPAWIEVGWTKGRPEDRAKELQSIGAPTPFKVEIAFFFSKFADEVADRTRTSLRLRSVSPYQNLFKCAPHHAAGAILLAVDEVFIVFADEEDWNTEDDAASVLLTKEDKEKITGEMREERWSLLRQQLHRHTESSWQNYAVSVEMSNPGKGRGWGMYSEEIETFSAWLGPWADVGPAHGGQRPKIRDQAIVDHAGESERLKARNRLLEEMKGCMLMFLGILGLITTVPLLLSKVTLF